MYRQQILSKKFSMVRLFQSNEQVRTKWELIESQRNCVIVSLKMPEMPPAIATNLHHTIGGNNLNINLPDNNAVLRLEVELRDKNARRRPNHRHRGFTGDGRNRAGPANGAVHQTPPNPNNFFIPMEKVRFTRIISALSETEICCFFCCDSALKTSTVSSRHTFC